MKQKPFLRIFSAIFALLLCGSIFLTPINAVITFATNAQGDVTITAPVDPQPTQTVNPEAPTTVTPSEELAQAVPSAKPEPQTTPTATETPTQAQSPTPDTIPTALPTVTLLPEEIPTASATQGPNPTALPSASAQPEATPSLTPNGTPDTSPTVAPQASPTATLEASPPLLEDDLLGDALDKPLDDELLDDELLDNDIPSNNVLGPQNAPSAIDNTRGYGDFSLTLPNESDTTYQLVFTLARLAYGTSDNLGFTGVDPIEPCTVVITNEYGVVTSTEELAFEANWSHYYMLTLPAVNSGSTVTINGILVKKLIPTSYGDWGYGSFDTTSINTAVTNNQEATEQITFDVENPTPLTQDVLTPVVASIPSAADTSGNFALVLPPEEEIDETTYYDATISVSHKGANDGTPLILTKDETYQVIVTDASGNVTSDEWFVFNINTQDPTKVELTLQDIASGSTITLKDVTIEYILGTTSNGYVEGSYRGTDVLAAVKQSGALINAVTYEGDNPASLVLGETVTLTTKLDPVASEDRTTADTFISLGGSYTILHMLNHYNVVSFDNIESTHIVGPILAADIAQRTQGEVLYNNGSLTTYVTGADTKSGMLAASDYANGVSSYVGTLIPSPSASNQSAFVLNYGFETTKKAGFIAPLFYTREQGFSTGANQNILEVVSGDGFQDYIQLDGSQYDGATYVSPNATGHQKTYQSNTFMELEPLRSALISGSNTILANGTAEDYTISYTSRYYYTEQNGVPVIIKGSAEHPVTYHAATNTVTGGQVVTTTSDGSPLTTAVGNGYQLNTDLGESWMILDSDKLDVVNLLYPEGYDYFTNPYPIPITFNFTGTEVNPTTIGGLTASQLPNMLVNGNPVRADANENGEYGQGGKKIIWNMPNLVTNSATGQNRLVTNGTGINVLGHIIAPQAEFWNYNEDTTGNLYWEGGNINGGVIVKSFYSGNAEMHMWPYDGENEYHVNYTLGVGKTIDGFAPPVSFDFELNPTASTAKNPGLANGKFPMIASTATSVSGPGYGNFSSLVFLAAGTYSFTIKEIIPDATASSALIYDLSEYQIDITVNEITTDDGKDLVISKVTQTQIVNSKGEPISDGAVTEYDGTASVSPVFNNTAPRPDLVDATFIKKSTLGQALTDVKFRVTEVVSDTDTTIVENGYYANITSDADGMVIIPDLPIGTYDDMDDDGNVTNAVSRYYKLIEYESAAGHLLSPGYWIITVDYWGRIFIDNYEGAPEVGDDLIIYNEPEDASFIDITLTKSSQMGHLLEGVEFLVERVVIEDGIPKPVVNGYHETYTTQTDGTFTIENLEGDYYYRITELTKPTDEDSPLVGYEPFTGYWIIETEGDVYHPSLTIHYTIKEYDQNHNLVSTVTDETLYNQKIEFKLPETGGEGTAPLVLAGTGLITIAILPAYLNRKYRQKQKGKPL